MATTEIDFGMVLGNSQSVEDAYNAAEDLKAAFDRHGLVPAKKYPKDAADGLSLLPDALEIIKATMTVSFNDLASTTAHLRATLDVAVQTGHVKRESVDIREGLMNLCQV